jgi:hypothetical protein
MVKEYQHVDISAVPELLRIAEEVRRTNEPQILSRANEAIAVVAPLRAAPRPRSARRGSQADHEAFLAAAGGWKDLLDAEQFKEEIAAARGSDRPVVDL